MFTIENMPRNRKQEILKTAKKRFTRYGYEETLMEHIAKSHGVTPQIIYYHFKTKAELFEAVIVEMFEAGLSSNMEIMNDPKLNPLEKLEAMFTAYRQEPFDILPIITSVYDMDESQDLFADISRIKITALVSRFEELIIEGCESGYFDCPYPAQTAYFCLYGERGIKIRHSGDTNELIDALKEMYWRLLGVKK
jgi:AcrR family transcriptional regulator